MLMQSPVDGPGSVRSGWCRPPAPWSQPGRPTSSETSGCIHSALPVQYIQDLAEGLRGRRNEETKSENMASDFSIKDNTECKPRTRATERDPGKVRGIRWIQGQQNMQASCPDPMTEWGLGVQRFKGGSAGRG